jgi:DNA-directed RNA polymerase specialized sigma24 family protein
MGDDFVRQVYEASYRRLVGQLYGVCGDLGEAEEVVEEAFARAIQHERKFQRTDNPEASLRTVAVNLSRSRWRRRILGERLQRASHRTEAGVHRDCRPSADFARCSTLLPDGVGRRQCMPDALRRSRRVLLQPHG